MLEMIKIGDKPSLKELRNLLFPKKDLGELEKQ